MLILERSISRNGQHRDAAAAVVGYDHELASRVDGLTNTVVPSRGAPDLRLLIVSYPRRRTMHAVLAVHWDEEWLLLDNLTMVMVNSLEATQYLPLIALDYQAMTTFAAGSPAPQEAPAAIQNISSVPKDLPSRSVAR